jgi:hypothetical protein
VSEQFADGVAVARSPIAPAPPVRVEAGWEVSGARSDAALTIIDCTPLAKVHLRAPWNGAMAKALGVPFGRCGREDADPGSAGSGGGGAPPPPPPPPPGGGGGGGGGRAHATSELCP